MSRAGHHDKINSLILFSLFLFSSLSLLFSFKCYSYLCLVNIKNGLHQAINIPELPNLITQMEERRKQTSEMVELKGIYYRLILALDV